MATDPVTIGRRDFLAGGLTAAAMLAAPRAWARMQAGANGFRLVGSVLNGSEAHLAEIDAEGNTRLIAPLPARAHHIVSMPPSQTIIAIGRRPGHFARVFDARTGAALAEFAPREGHYFTGHAAAHPGGDLLAVMEATNAGSQGILSLRQTSAQWREVARLPTGGIGPHAALWLDAATLAIANGGFADDGVRDPDPDTVQPALTLLDMNRLALAAAIRPPAELRAHSIRHLTAFGGNLALGLWEAGLPVSSLAPVAFWRGGGIEAAIAPEKEALRFKGYTGDILAFGAEGIAASSPRGNYVGFWSHRDGRWQGGIAMNDACALAAESGDCLIAAGSGLVARVAGNGKPEAEKLGRAAFGWDNHAALLPPLKDKA